MSELSNALLNVLFIVVDFYCILSFVPYFIIRKQPKLKEEFKRFEKIEILSVAVFLVGGILSMIYNTFTLFSIIMLVLIVVQSLIIFKMIHRFE